MAAARVGVILSGCGYIDGAEIQESVLSLYFLARSNLETLCFAPNKKQAQVINHFNGESILEAERNILAEAARIARGAISDLKDAHMSNLEALWLPGGYGVVKNLSDFASKGKNAYIEPELLRLLEEALAARKPIVAVCIAPALLAVALKKLGIKGARLTIGQDPETVETLNALGAVHQECTAEEIVVDEEHRLICTPAYMLANNPRQVGAGLELAAQKLAKWLTL